MRSPLDFLVTPKHKKYNSTTQIGNVEFTKAVSIENAKDVSKEGVVLAVPHNYNGIIEIGDEVLLHHNIFRDYYDQSGHFKHSRAHIYDGMYHCIEEEIFLVKKGDDWVPNMDYCIVEPVLEDTISLLDKGALAHTGNIYLSNTHKSKSPIGFTPESEYEIEIDGKFYYRMKDSDICLYERFEL